MEKSYSKLEEMVPKVAVVIGGYILFWALFYIPLPGRNSSMIYEVLLPVSYLNKMHLLPFLSFLEKTSIMALGYRPYLHALTLCFILSDIIPAMRKMLKGDNKKQIAFRNIVLALSVAFALLQSFAISVFNMSSSNIFPEGPLFNIVGSSFYFYHIPAIFTGAVLSYAICRFISVKTGVVGVFLIYSIDTVLRIIVNYPITGFTFNWFSFQNAAILVYWSFKTYRINKLSLGHLVKII